MEEHLKGKIEEGSESAQEKINECDKNENTSDKGERLKTTNWKKKVLAEE